MTPTYTTAAQAAKDIGCAKSTIIRACRKHGIGIQPGNERLLTAADVKKLRGLVSPGKKGCPMFVPGNDLWRRRKKVEK